MHNKCCEEWVCEEGGQEDRLETVLAGERWADGAVCWGVEAEPACLQSPYLHWWLSLGAGGRCVPCLASHGGVGCLLGVGDHCSTVV